MLGVFNETTIAQQWENLQSQAVLPMSPEEFFSYSGPMPKNFACQRTFMRHYLRCRAIMQRQHEQHAIYVKDCSRAGMGVISPVQLFPCERVFLWKEVQKKYQVEIVRCRKIGSHCYECGTIFVLK